MPLLVVAVAFVFAARLFKDIAVFFDIPIISALLVIAAVVVVVVFLWHYSRFAAKDPDRLQSEHFRVQMQRMQLIGAKGLPQPVAEDSLATAGSNPADEAGQADGKDVPRSRRTRT